MNKESNGKLKNKQKEKKRKEKEEKKQTKYEHNFRLFTGTSISLSFIHMHQSLKTKQFLFFNTTSCSNKITCLCLSTFPCQPLRYFIPVVKTTHSIVSPEHAPNDSLQAKQFRYAIEATTMAAQHAPTFNWRQRNDLHQFHNRSQFTSSILLAQN